uniref:Uncharacterized protein n=1 Tax=viral metagenome TaxID=1070528 RepID=A0A6C0JPY0_9ZZZZ
MDYMPGSENWKRIEYIIRKILNHENIDLSFSEAYNIVFHITSFNYAEEFRVNLIKIIKEYEKVESLSDLCIKSINKRCKPENIKDLPISSRVKKQFIDVKEFKGIDNSSMQVILDICLYFERIYIKFVYGTTLKKHLFGELI